MKNYEASIICSIFDKEYEFEDNLIIGISHSKEETEALLMDDIFRVMEDFGNDKCEIEIGRSTYDEAVTIVHTYDKDNDSTMHWHYYCLFSRSDNEDSETKE